MSHAWSLLAALLLACSAHALAQTPSTPPDSLQVLHFRIVDAATQQPVRLAHALNYQRGLGAISDRNGLLSIPMRFGDSLRVSAIGYHTLSVVHLGQLLPSPVSNTLAMRPRVYHIEEVKVLRFASYEHFLQAVINLQLPPTPQEQLQQRMQAYMMGLGRSMRLFNAPKATGGFNFGKSWLAKQQEKIDRAKVKEGLQRRIDQKYSPAMVAEMTGLSGDTLLHFIDSLHLTTAYLLETSEYDIRLLIKQQAERLRAKDSLPQSRQ